MPVSIQPNAHERSELLRFANDPPAAGEAALSAAAKHAYETLLYAFWLPEQSMTMGELRDALRRLYGGAVDRELEQYFYNSAATQAQAKANQ